MGASQAQPPLPSPSPGRSPAACPIGGSGSAPAGVQDPLGHRLLEVPLENSERCGHRELGGRGHNQGPTSPNQAPPTSPQAPPTSPQAPPSCLLWEGPPQTSRLACGFLHDAQHPEEQGPIAEMQELLLRAEGPLSFLLFFPLRLLGLSYQASQSQRLWGTKPGQPTGLGTPLPAE